MKLIDKDTNKDAIIAYLKDPDAENNLTVKQQQLLDYYVDAYTLIRNYSSVQDAINVLVKLSKKRGEQISQSTARRYIYDAQDVFGYVSKTKPEAIRHMATEIIRDAIAMARDQNRPDIMIAGAEKMMKVSGADEVEGFNAEMLEPHIIEIMLDPAAMQMLKILTQKGPVDLDTLMGNVMNSMADDAQLLEDGSTED